MHKDSTNKNAVSQEKSEKSTAEKSSFDLSAKLAEEVYRPNELPAPAFKVDQSSVSEHIPAAKLTDGVIDFTPVGSLKTPAETVGVARTQQFLLYDAASMRGTAGIDKNAQRKREIPSVRDIAPRQVFPVPREKPRIEKPNLQQFVVEKPNPQQLADHRAVSLAAVIQERSNLVFGRNNSIVERDFRDTLAISTKEEIDAIDKSYRAKFSRGIEDAIAKSSLSDTSKAAAKILLNGSDRRKDSDNLKLSEIALNHQNLDLFKEALRDISPVGRAQFLDEHGKERILKAFGGVLGGDTQASRHALDFAMYGKLDVATEINGNIGKVGWTQNDRGIELALLSGNVTLRDRQLYAIGRKLFEGKDAGLLSEDLKKDAQEFHSRVRAVLVKAGDKTAVERWENLLITGKEGFVSSLSRHAGWWNSSVDEIRKDINGISEQTWLDAKAHPERREELERMLSTIKGPSEVRELLDTYDKKLKPGSWDDARTIGRSVFDKLSEALHWNGADHTGALAAVRELSRQEQKQYRENLDFRTRLDQAVRDTLGSGVAQQAAAQVLDNIRQGKEPELDIISKLRLSAQYSFNSEQAVRDLNSAFQSDPKLRERFLNPRSDQDRKFAQDLKVAARVALGLSFNDFGRPLFENGKLPLEQLMKLNRGLISDNVQEAAKDVLSASPEEKERLRSDSGYRQQVLGFMRQEQQKIVLLALEQGELKAEDKIRASVLGWGGSSNILSTLASLKTPAEVAAVIGAYQKKFGNDSKNPDSAIEKDLRAKLNTDDYASAERIFNVKHPLELQYDAVRKDVYNARSGLTAWASDRVFGSGTGAQLDNGLSLLHRQYSDYKKFSRVLSDAQAAKAQTQIAKQVEFTQDLVENHLDARNTITEYTSAAAVIGAATLTAPFTGGTSYAGAAGILAAEGAAVNVGTKVLLSDNYRLTAGQVGYDAAIGGIGAIPFSAASRVANTIAGTTPGFVNGARQFIVDQAPNIRVGAISGGTTSGADAAFRIDPAEGLTTNFNKVAQAATLGTVLGSAAPIAFSAGGKIVGDGINRGYEAVKPIVLRSKGEMLPPVVYPGPAQLDPAANRNSDVGTPKRAKHEEPVTEIPPGHPTQVDEPITAITELPSHRAPREEQTTLIQTLQPKRLNSGDQPTSLYKDTPAPPSGRVEILDPVSAGEDVHEQWRQVVIDNQKFVLSTRDNARGWFYPKYDFDAPSYDVKVHIFSPSAGTTEQIARDLGSVNDALLPELFNPHSRLHQLIATFKTADPVAVDPGERRAFRPNATGQNSKLFTIFPKEGVDAFQVQMEVDRILSEKGLGFRNPATPGVADIIGGASNRVGIVREYAPQAELINIPGQAVALHPSIIAGLKQHLNIPPTEWITDAQLRQLEIDLKLLPNSVGYTRSGGLGLKLKVEDTKWEATPGKYYINERNSWDLETNIVDRKAYYLLAKEAGVDPAKLSY
ncbi:MAG: hypothetical protein C0469_14850 [Cyanobacteria bacterium DS2.3.42]|nr:hypothetical protein [Cyanobacteria bacterium DS2.3.42]